jgi:hypothetical protein
VQALSHIDFEFVSAPYVERQLFLPATEEAPYSSTANPEGHLSPVAVLAAEA